MDAMQIAQLRRQLAWHEEELRHTERDYHAAELAQENDKKKVEELKKKSRRIQAQTRGLQARAHESGGSGPQEIGG